MTTPGSPAVGSTAQQASIRTARVEEGPATGLRVIRLDVDAGISVEVCPDRTLDIFGSWFAGRNLSWLSRVGLVGPSSEPRDLTWLDRFGGGLVSTCGLDNVGAPSEEMPLHGTIGQRRADGVTTEVIKVDGASACQVRGHVDDVTSMGRHIRLDRTITTVSGEGFLVLEDRVSNLGGAEEPTPLLYHINLGWPLWAPGSTLTTGARWVETVEGFDGDVEDWAVAGDAIPNGEQSVFEHIAYPGTALTATVTSPTAGLTLELSWSGESLDRFTQWVHPASDMYALGLEPTNASVLGREQDRRDGRLRMLAPGEHYETRLEFRVAAEVAATE